MTHSLHSFSPAATRLLRVAGFAALVGLAASTASAQNQGAPNDPNGGRRQRGGAGGPGQDGGNGGRGSFSPEDMQARMLTGLRDRLGITNDEEWGLISVRVTAVMEARRAIGGGPGGPGGPGGFGGGRGGPPPGGDAGGRGGRGTRTSSQPEVAALQTAITDNLPEAEIKSRLERVREVRRTAEAKVQRAQEELRAVLTVKQEATAVLFGLLP